MPVFTIRVDGVDLIVSESREYYMFYRYLTKNTTGILGDVICVAGTLFTISAKFEGDFGYMKIDFVDENYRNKAARDKWLMDNINR
jgi:hypothetical protein